MRQKKQYQTRYEAIVETWANTEKTETRYSASGCYRRTYRAAFQDAVAGGTADMAGCVQQTDTNGGNVHRLYAQCDIDAAIRADARLRRMRRTNQ